MAITVIAGQVKQNRATDRHGINVFNSSTMNIPSVSLMNVSETKTPRVEGSLEILKQQILVLSY